MTIFNYICVSMEEPDFRTNTLLKPLSWIWAAFTSIRNALFDKGICRSESFPVPVISVGNITVGGTGKSPHTAYIASLLSHINRIAILSRGYGRRTKGFRIVSPSDTCHSIGDEPLMLSNILPDICVAVDEDRVHGIRTLIRNKLNPQVIILDDAFQHRRVTPSLNILLVNYNRNILHDCIMPAGRLRESTRNRGRADIIIVTKCPLNLDEAEMKKIASDLITNKNQKIYFSTFEYLPLYKLSDHSEYVPDNTTPILAVTGIAFPQPMITRLKDMSQNISLLSFPDHHSFTNKDLHNISSSLDRLGPEAIIITTEKDAARLRNIYLQPGLLDRIYILPITVSFLRDGKLFDEQITGHVKSFLKKQIHD